MALFGVSLTDEETVPFKDADGLTNLARLPNAKARASSVYANGALAIHQIKHLNDGRYNNAHSWISAGEPSWVEVDLGEVCRVAKVVFGSEHNAHYKDRAATRFEILVATDSNATQWNRVLEYEGDPVRDTTAFDFEPVAARYVRIVILEGVGGEPLTANNEYTPCVLPDGRLLYTRWEHMDKGADYSQSLGAIRPDGTNVTHLFGNNLTTSYSFLSARPILGTGKFVCTFASHWGDHVGPIGIVDPSLGRSHPAAMRNLTPEIPIGVYKGYRDPYPLSEEYFLVSYAPAGRFGIYLMDAHGNRELLYEDKTFSSFQPIPLAPRPKPLILPSSLDPNAKDATLLLLDVYRGLGDAVKRGTVKYLRIVEEYRHELPRRPDGTYQTNFGVLKANYASPTDEVAGPYGWPTYMAKYVHGIVPVEADGSAYFTVPADKPIYFQALDANLNEIQRMRSYTHLKAGETQTCIGCHEERNTTPPNQKGQLVNGSIGQSSKPLALRRAPSKIAPPSWGAGVFSFKKIVQPVLDKHCVSCHNSAQPQGRVDLSWTLGTDNVPASYRTLIRNGYVRYVDTGWHASNAVLKPLTFGTTQSRLIQLIDAHHYDVRLTAAERERVTTWIDLNCPLWDNYEPSLRAQR